MKNLSLFLFIISLLFTACSDSSFKSETYDVPNNTKNPEALSKTAQTIIRDADITPEMLIKSKVFNSALTANGNKDAGIYIYRYTIEKYLPTPERLAARVILMGYTDVFLAINPVNGAKYAELRNKDWIKKFNKYLKANNVKVHALMFSEAPQYDPAKNNYIDIHATVIQQFNITVANEEQFSGAAADWEPHSLVANNWEAGYADGEGANLSSADFWANSRYTKGGANDRLLLRTGEMLKYAKNALDKISLDNGLVILPLNEAVNYHVQEQHNNGNLNNGDVTTYLAADKCSSINVMAYNRNKDNVWARSKFIVEAAERNNLPKSVYMCIKTQIDDDEANTTSLQPEGWDYLIETMNFLHAQAKAYGSVKGIAVYEYSGTETMWMDASK